MSMIRFKNGALAISETSLVAPYTPRICEVYGTKGAILCENDNVRIQTDVLRASDNGGWIVPNLPKALPAPIRQWVDSCLYGKEVRFGIKEGRELTELMESAYAAYNEKKEISF